MHFAVALDLDFEALRQRVGDRYADAVQAAGKCVRGVRAFLVELAAGMEPREHELNHRRLFLGMRTDGNAASVVLDRNRAVGMHRHVESRRVPAQRFVGGIVDHLLHDMRRIGRPRIHARPFLDRLQSFQYANRRFFVPSPGQCAHSFVVLSMIADARSPDFGDLPHRSCRCITAYYPHIVLAFAALRVSRPRDAATHTTSWDFIELLALFAAFIVGALLWGNLRARETANAAIREACEAHNFFFLNDTVALESLWPGRDEIGHMRLRRVYSFEYSDTGHNRRRGMVIVVANAVRSLDVGEGSLSPDTARP